MDVQHEYFCRVQALNKEIIHLQRAKSNDVKLESIHSIRRLSLEMTLFISKCGRTLFGDDFDSEKWTAQVEQDSQGISDTTTD